MKSGIQIVNKPDWVSWEEIKQCLTAAHATNRANGISMAHYQWPADKIQEMIGKKGVMLVALDGSRVVGTAALCEKTGKAWYAAGPYAYMCFAGVLPEYRGQGIYKALVKERERIAQELGFDVFLLDTHSRNRRIQDMALMNEYRYVRFFRSRSRDHYSVMMVKRLSGWPHSKIYCSLCYSFSRLKTLIFTPINH